MKILVTGGAGYIGSFMTKRLLDDGFDVVVVDNLEKGKKEAVDVRAEFVMGDLRNKEVVKEIFSKHQIQGIIHFSGYISTAESVIKPFTYFENNILPVLNILEEIKDKNILGFIFSSTAGIYGNPSKVPIPEDLPAQPESPYGESKYMAERVLEWYQKIHEVNFVSLRYFNASGAALDGSMGELHEPETHIIPCAIEAILREKSFSLYGTDYDTPDGSCIRDYIHVLDLAEAHILAIKKLQKDKGGFIYNVGTGKGYSNKEVVQMVEKISGEKMKVDVKPRRTGDPGMLIADPSRINRDLAFLPKHSDLETIVKSAWEWHKKNFKD